MADTPDPEVAPRAVPRRFAPSYKRRILAELAVLDRPERAALLRREGLYSTLITKWEKQAARDGGTVAPDRAPGPKPAPGAERQIAALTARIAVLESELDSSRRINDVQAKLCALLDDLSKSAPRAGTVKH